MEYYLVGEDLWEVIGSTDVNPPESTLENTDALNKWGIANAKVGVYPEEIFIS